MLFVSKEWTDLSSLNNAGVALALFKRFDSAAQACARAAELYPGEAVCHYNFGKILTEAGEFEKALDRSERAIACDEDFREARILRAVALEDLGRADDAVAELRTIEDQVADETLLLAFAARAERGRMGKGRAREVILFEPPGYFWLTRDGDRVRAKSG